MIVEDLKDVGFVPVEDDPFIVDVVCTCEECGNKAFTWQFLEDELLPSSMFCIKCGKNTSCRSTYVR